MNWVIVIWSAGSGACLTLALMNFAVWWKNRAARANLVFSVMAVAVAVFAALELAMMRAQTPEQFGMAVRWAHVAVWVIVASVVLFVRLYLRAGRLWLAWTVIGLRTLSLVLNFIFWPNINYRQIAPLRHVIFLGESVSVATGVPNPWMLVAQLSLLLLVIFVADATIQVWRRGEPRKALTVGGSILLFTTAGTAEGITIAWGIISMPLTASLFYQGLVAVMACELSYDVLHAAKTTRRLQASESELREAHQRMDLATSAAGLGLWVWDIVRDEIWISEQGRVLFGLGRSEKLDSGRFRNAIHPDDRESLRQAVQNSFSTGAEYEAEHRVVLPDGQIRWLAEHGRVEFNDEGKPARMRGVSRDVTRRMLGEQALRESEARFRTVANTAPVMIWMSGLDKLCTFFNKSWLEFTGRSLEQEIGNGWAEGVHPDDLQRCFRIYTEAFDARQPFVMQYRLKRHDGEYRWISDNGVPRYNAEKNFVGYIGSCVDVTDLITREQALHDSNERMDLATKAAGLIVWTWDIARDEVWLSEKDRSLFGLSPSEKLTAKRIRSVIHPDDREFVRQLVEKSLKTNEELEGEYRIVLGDGRVRWVTRRGRVEFDGDGNPLCERGVLMDITEVVKNKEALREFEERVVLAAKAAHLGVWEMDTATNEIWMSDSAVSLFQFDPDTRLNHAVLQDRVHPEDRSLRDAAVKDAIETRGEYEIEYRVVLPDGTVRWIGARGRCVAGKNGKGPRLIGVSIDITPRKLAEAEAARNREELGHLSRVAAMGELAASIAHELNQPLSGITINASTAQRLIDHGDVDLGELRDVLSDIVADGRRAGEVIRGIQHMVKKGSPGRQRVNLNDVVTNVARMVNPNAILRSCNLETLLEPNLPDIEANPVQLQQVLLNLIINAFDAVQDTPVGRRKVVVATERNGDGTIRTSVRDYGTGIPEEMRERVFEQFFTTKANGVGMGLAIARSIVKSHGGSIAVENVDGGGACFHLTFPASPSGRLPV
jgi:PAS domain S-box-containing protein